VSVSRSELRIAVDRVRELFSFIAASVRQAAPTKRMEVLSLASVVRTATGGQEVTRFVDLTQASTTSIDENVLAAMHELFMWLDYTAMKALERATAPPLFKAVWTTYARGKASENFVQLNTTDSLVLLNTTTLLAELQNIVAVVHELAAIAEAIAEEVG